MNRHQKIRQTLLAASLLLTLTIHAESDLESRDARLSEQFHRYYSEMMVDSALSTLDELISVRHELGDAEREGMARWNRIATLNNAARYDSLLIEADRQMEWFKEHKIWGRFYQCWQRRCSANHDLGRMQTALRKAEEYQAKSSSALATYYIYEMHTRLALAQNRVAEAPDGWPTRTASWQTRMPPWKRPTATTPSSAQLACRPVR